MRSGRRRVLLLSCDFLCVLPLHNFQENCKKTFCVIWWFFLGHRQKKRLGISGAFFLRTQAGWPITVLLIEGVDEVELALACFGNRDGLPYFLDSVPQAPACPKHGVVECVYRPHLAGSARERLCGESVGRRFQPSETFCVTFSPLVRRYSMKAGNDFRRNKEQDT